MCRSERARPLPTRCLESSATKRRTTQKAAYVPGHIKCQLHWAAVIEIAETLIAAEWLSAPENEHPLAKRKKRLDGNQLIDILVKHGISARVRHPV